MTQKSYFLTIADLVPALRKVSQDLGPAQCGELGPL